jgi:glycosyltransferase involved in cell wall biosynthesis
MIHFPHDEEDKSIKVWALFRFYYPNFAGPAIQAPRTLAPLLDQGFDITVLAAAENRAAHLVGQDISIYGMSTRYLPVIERRTWDIFSNIKLLYKILRYLNGLASDLSLSLQFALTLQKFGKAGDIVQMYTANNFNFLVTWIAKSRRMPTVIQTTLLGSDSPGSFGKGILGKLRLRAYQDAEVVIGLSTALTQSCLEAGLHPEIVHLIPNGVDLDVFQPVTVQKKLQLRNKLQLSAERRYIIFVGAAVQRKGIDILVKAFVELGHKVADVDLLVVGPNDFNDHSRYSPDRQQLIHELQALLEHNQLSPRVSWIGSVEDVHEYLQAADIFCFPTRREGLPTVIAEAMATGLPVVTSNLEGVTTDFIASGVDGILIDQPDPSLYAQSLEFLLRNPDRGSIMGARARRRAEREFSLSLATQRYRELYEKLFRDLNLKFQARWQKTHE